MSGPQQEAREHYEKQRRQAYHQNNLSGADGGEGIQLLNQLAQNRDLPIQPDDDDIIGQFASEATAESNLSEAEIESIKWEREIQVLLWLCKQPTEDGLTGTRRGWAHGDMEEEIDGLTPKERGMVESFLTSHKEILALSKEGFGVKESGRSISQSIVDEGDEAGNSGGGLMDKLGF